ncbi:MAG: archaellin/type IV pilin N-terminal domain-containing protein [Nanoarchaeota archaeon]
MNKKGLSEVVGYVLLIAIAISLSIVVYSFMKSYVPKESTSDCPSGTSMIIADYKCDTTKKVLNLTLQNKGLFDIDGFIIRISVVDDGENIPSKELSYNNGTENVKTSVMYFDTLSDLTLHPSQKFNRLYNYSEYANINKIQIIPLKLYKGENLLCGGAQIMQNMEGCQ